MVHWFAIRLLRCGSGFESRAIVSAKWLFNRPFFATFFSVSSETFWLVQICRVADDAATISQIMKTPCLNTYTIPVQAVSLAHIIYKTCHVRCYL